MLYFRISSSSIAGKMRFFFFLVPGHQNKKEEDQFWRLETGADLEIQTRGLISFFPLSFSSSSFSFSSFSPSPMAEKCRGGGSMGSVGVGGEGGAPAPE